MFPTESGATAEDCAGCKEKEADDTYKNIEDYDDVEKDLDKKLRDNGWTKGSPKDGNGVKYTSPNENKQVQLNKGYPKGSSRGPSDDVDSGPISKKASDGKRVPMKGRKN